MAQLKKNPPIIFDYKDVKTLQRYINVYGQNRANQQDWFERKATAKLGSSN